MDDCRSEPWTLEFVDLRGDGRRNLWMATIKEVISVKWNYVRVKWNLVYCLGFRRNVKPLYLLYFCQNLLYRKCLSCRTLEVLLSMFVLPFEKGPKSFKVDLPISPCASADIVFTDCVSSLFAFCLVCLLLE
jgi:hypothetical protein